MGNIVGNGLMLERLIAVIARLTVSVWLKLLLHKPSRPARESSSAPLAEGHDR